MRRQKGIGLDIIYRTGILFLHLPTMLHVLWFVHADSQLNPQVMVRTGLSQGHLVKLSLLRTVWGRVQNNLFHHQTNQLVSQIPGKDPFNPNMLENEKGQCNISVCIMKVK